MSKKPIDGKGKNSIKSIIKKFSKKPKLKVIRGQNTPPEISEATLEKFRSLCWQKYILQLFIAGFTHQDLMRILSVEMTLIKQLAAGNYRYLRFNVAAAILVLHFQQCPGCYVNGVPAS